MGKPAKGYSPLLVGQRNLELSAIGDGWRALYLHMPMSKREKPILTWHGPNLDTPISICREPSQLSRNQKQYINVNNMIIFGLDVSSKRKGSGRYTECETQV